MASSLALASAVLVLLCLLSTLRVRGRLGTSATPGLMQVSFHPAELVNTVKKGTDAKVPLMFNYNPWTTLEAVQRWLPLGDCAAKQGTNYVSSDASSTDASLG